MSTNLQNNPRFLATELLTRIEKQGTYANLGLDQVMKSADLSLKDKQFLTTLVYGVIQHQLTIDYYLAPFLHLTKKAPYWLVPLLRTAIYQMVYLDKVPKHAIFYETVEIAKEKGHIGLSKLVNGVLRNFERAPLPDLTKVTPVSKQFSLRFSVPEWLVAIFLAQFGDAETEMMLETINQPSEAAMRVNTRITNVEAEFEALVTENTSLEKSLISTVGLVARGGHFAGSDAFKAGKITMQDESAQLVAPAMRIEPGFQVLDACAAPGGKTTQIATYLSADQGGRVTALDIHEKKIKLINQNAKRLQVSDVVWGEACDARKAHEQFPAESFDRILVDAPCSGLGLMRRKPEIRYSKKPEDFLKLQQIQLDILTSVAQTLKQKGIITYSTCTIIKEENQDVVDNFLATHPDFIQIEVPLELPLPKNQATPAVQIYPQDYGSDGFYIACLQRIK